MKTKKAGSMDRSEQTTDYEFGRVEKSHVLHSQ